MKKGKAARLPNKTYKYLTQPFYVFSLSILSLDFSQNRFSFIVPDIHSNAQNVYFYFRVVGITAFFMESPPPISAATSSVGDEEDYKKIFNRAKKTEAEIRSRIGFLIQSFLFIISPIRLFDRFKRETLNEFHAR
jgi:hypothetical protein